MPHQRGLDRVCRRLGTARKSLRHRHRATATRQLRAQIKSANDGQQQAGDLEGVVFPRRMLISSVAIGAALATPNKPASASKLGGLFDKAWEAIGGGPDDLYFPDAFAGRWIVDATLTKVDMPLGAKFVPDVAVSQSSSAVPCACSCPSLQ